MSEEFSLITSLVTAFGLALCFGYLAERFLKTPALVGYLIAGISVSLIPGLPPVNVAMTEQLADIGVMLLMFGVGLHFSIKNLLKVKGVAIPGALLQMGASSFLGTVFAMLVWNWILPSAIVFGLCLSCASTVVVTKALEMRHETTSMSGQATIGWLIVQDLVTVVIMVLLPPLANILVKGENLNALEIAIEVASTLAGVVCFVAIMLVAGRKVFPWILKKVALTGSRELFTLAVLGIAIGIAYGAGAIFHVSYALGAFFAGVVLQESRYAHRAATNSLPLQDAFAVLFFVSVGLMLDSRIFIDRPFEVITVVLIILAVTSAVSFMLVVLLKWPLQTALIVAASVAEIGEFSYILAAQGISLGMADTNMMSLIVAASIISIAINPGFFTLIPKVQERLLIRYSWARKAANRQPPFSELPAHTPREMRFGQIIIAGYNDLVPGLIQTFLETQRRVIIVCASHDPIEELQSSGVGVVVGDPTDPMVLVQAHVASAAAIILPMADAITAHKTLVTAKELNNSLKVIVRVAHIDDTDLFNDTDETVSVLTDPITTSFALASRTLEVLSISSSRKPAREDSIEEDEPQGTVDARDIFEREYKQIVSQIRGKEKVPEAIAPLSPEALKQAEELKAKAKVESLKEHTLESNQHSNEDLTAETKGFFSKLTQKIKETKLTTFTKLDVLDNKESKDGKKS